VSEEIEVERGEVRGHEMVERGEDALEVVVGVGLAHQCIELNEAM
jgi:hypothetical protein